MGEGCALELTDRFCCRAFKFTAHLGKRLMNSMGSKPAYTIEHGTSIVDEPVFAKENNRGDDQNGVLFFCRILPLQ